MKSWSLHITLFCWTLKIIYHFHGSSKILTILPNPITHLTTSSHKITKNKIQTTKSSNFDDYNISSKISSTSETLTNFPCLIGGTFKYLWSFRKLSMQTSSIGGHWNFQRWVLIKQSWDHLSKIGNLLNFQIGHCSSVL